MFAWEPLLPPDDDRIWEEFQTRYRFQPSTHERDWPSIREPAPSVTWRLKEGPSPDGAHAWGLRLFGAAERIIALDWQHPCYWFDPRHPDALADWNRYIPLLPDGDYSIFLTEDLENGLFAHPWERSLCVFGVAWVERARADPPDVVERVLRRRD